ncbi:hypothetical protein CLOSYM_00549, partial [[Clostridium] symbiosum ATCC 14940]
TLHLYIRSRLMYILRTGMIYYQFDDPALEESWQAAEYDAFFNSPEEEEGELYTSSYAGDDPVFEQLVITNQLLTYSLAVNLVVYFLIIAFFVIRFIRSLITKIFI